MNDNKILRTNHKSQQFVITVVRDGVVKYIDRNFSKHCNCTVLLNRAKRFQSEKQAMQFAENIGVCTRCKITPVTINMQLSDGLLEMEKN